MKFKNEELMYTYLITKPQHIERYFINRHIVPDLMTISVSTSGANILKGDIYSGYKYAGYESKTVLPIGKYTYRCCEYNEDEKICVIYTYENGLCILRTNTPVIEFKASNQYFKKLICNAIFIPEEFSVEYNHDACLMTKDRKKIILEGADYSGKTYLANKIVSSYGIWVQERDIENISLYIRDSIKRRTIADVVSEGITTNSETLYVILSTSLDIIQDRKMKRGVLSSYDRIAEESNKIYWTLQKDLGRNIPNLINLYIDEYGEDSFSQLRIHLIERHLIS